jgi:hypothetical protein
MVRVRVGRVVPFACAAVMVLSCGGGSSPSPSAPNGNPTTAPPPTSAPTATPTTPAPAAASACPYGKGHLDAQCGRGSSQYSADVERALTTLIDQQPKLFNLNDQLGPGTPRVVNVPDYFAGIVRLLQGAGYCAESDGVQNVLLKKSADLSEKYAILTSSNFVRRGDNAYRESCNPAIFPVDDADRIASIRVAFFSIRCPEGITPPDNAAKKLPIGCTGYISATPKDLNNQDVPAAIHGPDIFWEVFQGEGENLARVTDFPGQNFNKVVDPIDAGYLTLCATVKAVKGCLGFDTFHP